MLGPIVLGRGQNGATISLHPGTFIATAEVHICNAEGETEDAVAYRGVTRLIDWRSSSDDGTSIVIYAIDIRAHTADEAVDYDVPPVIMSIEISPRTIEVDGSAAQIVVRDCRVAVRCLRPSRSRSPRGCWAEGPRISLAPRDASRNAVAFADNAVVVFYHIRRSHIGDRARLQLRIA